MDNVRVLREQWNWHFRAKREELERSKDRRYQRWGFNTRRQRANINEDAAEYADMMVPDRRAAEIDDNRWIESIRQDFGP